MAWRVYICSRIQSIRSGISVYRSFERKCLASNMPHRRTACKIVDKYSITGSELDRNKIRKVVFF
jgi:hypothetical protein